MFEAIVRSNGWDGVTAALQLLSHLDGDALNVALLVPESQRVKSLSDHYSSPGRLAEYKRQFPRFRGRLRRPPPEVAPIPSDQDLLIQRLIGAIRPSQPMVQ